MAYTAGPILSPGGAGENRPPRCRQSRAPGLVAARDALFPLPEGEGKGEGEPDVANQIGWTNLASPIRPVPRASSQWRPKTNRSQPRIHRIRLPPLCCLGYLLLNRVVQNGAEPLKSKFLTVRDLISASRRASSEIRVSVNSLFRK